MQTANGSVLHGSDFHPIGVAYCKHFICAFVVELERLNFFQQGQRIGLRLCTATCSSPETIHSNGFLRQVSVFTTAEESSRLHAIVAALPN
mmetsp:Transcript_6326/g.14853  ORF Transcript_6326/g.14853 Transcript_6326/m.14853 type:complete len:91 (-) Transcript_6326:91-363(-)